MCKVNIINIFLLKKRTKKVAGRKVMYEDTKNIYVGKNQKLVTVLL